MTLLPWLKEEVIQNTLLDKSLRMKISEIYDVQHWARTSPFWPKEVFIDILGRNETLRKDISEIHDVQRWVMVCISMA